MISEHATWKALEAHAKATKTTTIANNFEESSRLEAFTFDLDGMYIDISKQNIDQKTMQLLYELAATKHVREATKAMFSGCLLYTSPSPRDATLSRMPSSA